MKYRSTTLPVTNRSLALKGSLIAAALLMAVATPMAFMNNDAAFARDYAAEIRAVEQQINQYQAEASRLSAEANTLENELAKITAEKAAIQAQIDLNQSKYDKLVVDIKANEEKIAKNQDTLGTIIADMYVDDDISPIEMLASSKNISEFLDKQTQRSAVRDTLKDTIGEIKELKKQLEQQQKEVEQVLADQKSQRSTLAAKEAEQANLVNQTRGQEAAYQQLSSQGKARRDQIMREQQAAIAAAMRSSGGGSAVAGDPNKGGYPANLANSDYYNPVVDPWGMYSRQCVSYTAWKVYQKNGYMPYWGGRGNANQWPAAARSSGYAVGTTPRAGSVGVIMAGTYGHVVWVESVNGNGTINISQYNYFNAGGSGWGHYSEMYNISPSAYDYYIYF